MFSGVIHLNLNGKFLLVTHQQNHMEDKQFFDLFFFKTIY